MRLIRWLAEQVRYGGAGHRRRVRRRLRRRGWLDGPSDRLPDAD